MSTRLVCVLIPLLLALLPPFAGFYTEWLWFGETGYQSVFLKSLATRGMLGVGVFLIAFGILFANLRLALRGPHRPYKILQGGGDTPPLFIEQRHLRRLAAGVSGLAALFVGSIASSQWLVALTFWPWRKRPPLRSEQLR